MVVVAVSSLIAVVLLFVGYVDRDQNGVVRWSGRVWTLVGMAIVCGWISAGWAMWADPDRLREGQAYWGLAVPVFGVGSFLVSLACLLAWWATRWVLKRGWIPALVVPVVAWPIGGPWGAVALLVACLAADVIFSKRRIPST